MLLLCRKFCVFGLKLLDNSVQHTTKAQHNNIERFIQPNMSVCYSNIYVLFTSHSIKFWANSNLTNKAANSLASATNWLPWQRQSCCLLLACPCPETLLEHLALDLVQTTSGYCQKVLSQSSVSPGWGPCQACGSRPPNPSASFTHTHTMGCSWTLALGPLEPLSNQNSKNWQTSPEFMILWDCYFWDATEQSVIWGGSHGMAENVKKEWLFLYDCLGFTKQSCASRAQTSEL